MREEDESNIRGGETDMDLYTPVDSLVMMRRGHGGAMKDPAITALEALGHVKMPNPRCTARYKDGPSEVPGPPSIPVWCDLKAGHEGPHKHAAGHRFMVMDRESRIEMVSLPDICQKCGTRWPCQDAEKVLNAFANSEPCACYPEHCTNTDHGECWCSPTREGNLIIHNQAS